MFQTLVSSPRKRGTNLAASWYSAKLKWNRDFSQLALVQCSLPFSLAELPNLQRKEK